MVKITLRVDCSGKRHVEIGKMRCHGRKYGRSYAFRRRYAVSDGAVDHVLFAIKYG